MTASPVAATTVPFNPETRLYIDGGCAIRPRARPPTTSTRPPKKCSAMHRRRRRRHGRGDRRRAPGLRHHRLVDQPRVPPALPHAVARRAARGEGGHARRADRRGRRDGGKTYIAQLEWPLADAVRWPAEYISKFPWERMLDEDAKMGVPYNRVVVKEPMGVVGAITPWNFPFEIISNKVGQILATGNTMVLKPAIETPWSALRWGRIIAEKTDIPRRGQHRPASDNDVAQVLLTDPRVDMVSFTGSTAVGKLIQRLSGETMKRNMLELGGKSAYLVLDDADMDMALPGCHRRADALRPGLRAGDADAGAAQALRPGRRGRHRDIRRARCRGSGRPDNFCGPLVSAKQRDRVLGYIEIGKEQGGRVTVGGGEPEGLDRGYFVAPTVFADVDTRHRDLPGGDLRSGLVDHALRRRRRRRRRDGQQLDATDWRAPMIGSNERAMAVARRIRTGSLMVNSAMYYGADAPFGGYKMSGIGRQNGIEGFEQHLQTKTHRVPRRPVTDILSGIRVVELAAWTFVPAAGAVLADWGADVIKVEHPETGDPQRGLISSGIVTGAGGVNHFIEQPNRGKRSIGLDTSTPDGLELLMKLVETADVFLTNLLPDSRAADGHRRRTGARAQSEDHLRPRPRLRHQGRPGRAGRLRPGGLLGARRDRRGLCRRATARIRRCSARRSATCTAGCRSPRASPARCSSANAPASRRWWTCRCSTPRSGSSARTSSARASPARTSRSSSSPRCRTPLPASTRPATAATSRSCCCRPTGSGPTSARGSAGPI